MEEDGLERQKQSEEEEKLDSLRRQIRIEDEKRKVDEHDAKVRGFAESVMARKEARIKEEERKHKEEERQQEIHDRINSLFQISPDAADAYIQTMKKANAI